MSRLSLRALLAIACGLICAAALVACGGDEEQDAGAQQVIDDTFATSASSLKRANLNASLQLDPEGLLALGGPIRLKVTGPFGFSGARTVPRFDFDIAATLAGQTFTGGALSTGKEGFVRLDDRSYKFERALDAKLREGLGTKGTKGLTALGIDPRRWITDPVEKGPERIMGVDTLRVGGTVDVRRMLDDIAKLLDRMAGSGGLLSADLRKTLADSVDAAKVDVWTGEADKLLRQILVTIDFAFDDGQESPITGLDGGKLTIRLRLDDVNEPIGTIDAPANARPLSQITGDKSLGALLAGLGASITGGKSGADGGAAFLGCLTGAGGSSAEIVRCASKLSE